MLKFTHIRTRWVQPKGALEGWEENYPVPVYINPNLVQYVTAVAINEKAPEPDGPQPQTEVGFGADEIFWLLESVSDVVTQIAAAQGERK